MWRSGSPACDPDGTLDDAADTRRRFTMAPAWRDESTCAVNSTRSAASTSNMALAALMNGDRPRR